MVPSTSGRNPHRQQTIRIMKVNISFLYLMPVLVITDIAVVSQVVSNKSNRDRVTPSVRRLLWKSGHYRHVQSKPWPRIPLLEQLPVQETYKNGRPNIILILTDDQDVELGSLNFMSETSRLMREGGAEFRHAYTTTPMCCPSRSSILTGLYVHNHNVYTNNDNCSNFQWQMEHETKSFAVYLSNAGYHTGYFGKYLNKYNGSYIPPGWKEWGGLIMNSKYYNYSINSNGKRIRHGDDYSKDYYTDLVANDSVNFLREWKTWNSNKPALLVMSFPAPHGPEDSAPQYSNMFLNVTTHHTPSYDYAPNPDKQWILQVTGPMMPIHKQFTNMLMTKRLQTLQSVDSAVKRIYEQLKDMDELENTYIIYTSDHGYHLGQFGLVKGKSFPFEFDVRVPFLVRGPGIEPGSIINEIALNIDLAPTILDIAGLPEPAHMDGKSLMKLFHKRKKNGRKHVINWPDTFLIESSGRRETPFAETDFMIGSAFATLSGTESTSNSYSLRTDPSSITEPSTDLVESKDYPSLSMQHGGSTDDVTIKKEESMDDFLHLAYSSKAERLSVECQRPEYASPCKAGQKWHCVLKENRWRKHKCKFSNNLAPPTALPNLQKCTCITEDGIVYMRFQTADDNNTDAKGTDKIHQSGVHYLTLNKSSGELVNELANSWRVMKRQRRNTAQRLEKMQAIAILDVVDGQIIELPSFGNRTNNTACMVSFDGSVKCSPEIYQNPALWRASQKSLTMQIKRLQNQIRKLKEIQKHLENMQPNSISIDKSSVNGIEFRNASSYLLPDIESSESNILSSSSTEILTSHKHRHHHDDTRLAEGKMPVADTTESEAKLTARLTQDNSIPDTCYCIPHLSSEMTSQDVLREQKRRIKEHRMKKKERKLKKRAKLGKVCFLEKMNCFNHDNDHWRTPPYWNDGSFCFCMNANNNTYNCIRTINTTHNFLYCEFVTGLTSFYNLVIDPFQQWNRYNTLSTSEKYWLRDTLSQMVRCKGHRECGLNRNTTVPDTQNYQKRFPSALDRKSERRKYMRYSRRIAKKKS